MSNWKTRMKGIFEGNGDTPPSDMLIKAARMQMKTFFKGVVISAFTELKAELENYGRKVTIDVDENTALASIYVYVQSVNVVWEEEFYFEIRGRTYQQKQFTFPAQVDENAPRNRKAEIVLRSGSLKEYDLEDLPKEEIIDQFLKEYSKWVKF
ncbi:MAG: hypothetical protein U9N13_03655 [Euryarchaeota archaeon]|nr:hypothetical protein [Euryarchaeota archaeon]